MRQVLTWGIGFMLLVGTQHAASLRIRTEFQQRSRIVYGDLITGEITHEKPADDYIFTGNAGDVVVVEMRSADRSLDNPLAEPVLILRDTAGEILVNTVEVFPIDDTILAAELPADGDYTLTATRDENVERLATGEYTLELMLVPQLSSNPVEGTIETVDVAHYYAVSSEAPFYIAFARVEGEYTPQVTISRIVSERDGRRPVAVAYGSELYQAVLGQFAPDTTYLIEIHQNSVNFYFDVEAARYTLRVTAR